MELVFWATLGVLVGSMAKILFWDDRPGWVTVLLAGVAGALLGGCISLAFLEPSEVPGFDLPSMALCLAGAALAVFIEGKVMGRGRPRLVIEFVRFDRRDRHDRYDDRAA